MRMSILVPFLVRSLVLIAVYVVALLAINASDTTDPLGPGLLVFFAFVAVALVWGTVDGARGSAPRAILVWVLAGAVLGVATSVGILVQDTDSSFGEDLAFSVPFFAVLIGLPAALGAGVGALIRRGRD